MTLSTTTTRIILFVSWMILCQLKSSFVQAATSTSGVSSLRGNEENQRSLQAPTQINFLGNNGRPSNAFPLPRCGGDCDDDDDCEGTLVCFQRDAFDAVPGCIGGEEEASETDFCVNPNSPIEEPQAAQESTTTTDNPTNSIPTPTPTSSPAPTNEPVRLSTPTPAPVPITPAPTPELTSGGLGLCQGDCFQDGDCDGYLVCYKRVWPGEVVPGCGVGFNDQSMENLCIMPNNIGPTLPPTPRPTIGPTLAPTPFPTPPPAPPVPISEQAFTMRLYWEDGYCWQDLCEELEWCVYYNYDRSYCFYNNRQEDDCEDDRLYIDECDRRSEWDHRFRFLSVGNGEVMIQTEYGDNCWARVRSRIYLEPCENVPSQRWYAPNGSFLGDRFEISQFGTDICVSQNHHPKEREIVEMHSCEDARDDDTSYWRRL